MRPKIALIMSMLDSEYFKAHTDYFEAVWDQGGIGVSIPYREDAEYINDVACEFEGFIFCGGSDIDPSYYKESNTHSKNICSKRDAFEYKLFQRIYSEGKPILGICRGMQVINVFLGGSLIQHIDGHIQDNERYICTHKVELEKYGLLFKIVGNETVRVNSFHHQAIKTIAPPLAIDAVSPDGIIEAVHAKCHSFCLGVQWHPENIYRIDPASSAVFASFISAAKAAR